MPFVKAAFTVLSMSEITHRDIIDAIGTKQVAQAYGLSRQRLYAWRNRGIPHSHRVAIARLAAMNGVALPSDFFEGMAA